MNKKTLSEVMRYLGGLTSDAKAKAARKNGKKGGRPRESCYPAHHEAAQVQSAVRLRNLETEAILMRVAIYCRVSTEKQETENQAVQLREFAAKQGWTVYREYVDYESGAKADRGEFKRMFVDASRRKFDVLLFWALDRLSREGVLETLQHLRRLES
jgi:DNA invertase Pin-like site-specific DNA recombinase